MKKRKAKTSGFPKLLSETALFFVFVVSTATIAHFLFSHLGYHPTDDGFMLAYSKRILDGQVPHRDFLSAHMMGTPILFSPVVAWGGEYTFLIGRFFVFVEFAIIAWLWTTMVFKAIAYRASGIIRIILAIIAFALCAHNFPIMPWYTIDGLLAASVAIFFLLQESKRSKTIGYLMLGIACLFKQNYALVIPPTLFYFGEWRSLRSWIITAIPVFFYYAFLTLLGAGIQAITQTTSRQEFADTAVKGFISKFTMPWGVLIGFFSMSMQKHKNTLIRYAGSVLLALPLLYSSLYLSFEAKFMADGSFFLMGSAAGMGLYSWLYERKNIFTKLVITAVTLAWAVGISGGYNTPALASGIMFLFPMCYILKESTTKRFTQLLGIGLLCILLVITISNFYQTRRHNIYRDKPVPFLTYELSGVLPGGRGIYTSKETYELLSDLNIAMKKAKTMKSTYILLPEYSGLWVKASEKNPYLMDWPLLLNNQKGMIAALLNDLEKKHGNVVLIVNRQKITQEVSDKPYAFFEIATKIPPVFKKVSETKYFDIYL